MSYGGPSWVCLAGGPPMTVEPVSTEPPRAESGAVDDALLSTVTRQVITRAAENLWPGEPSALGPQYPGAASYVCRVTVGDEELVAKYSWLGLPLISILRGTAGTWGEVQDAQSAYVRSTELLTAGEARGLEFLRGLDRPRVCDTVGLHDGVLFTRPVDGIPVADALADRPWETRDLLDATLASVAELHSPATVTRLRQAETPRERSIVGDFQKTFRSPHADRYLRALGQDSGLPEHERQEVADLVQTAVRRLLRMTTSVSSRKRIAVYGDLKPEHVYIDGPRLTFIDPAVQWAPGPHLDIVRLTGRALLIALGHPEVRARHQIVQGVAAVLAQHVAAVPERERDRMAHLREVLILWLMDTLIVLSTLLSAPRGFPLTPRGQALVARARAVVGVVDRASALLVGSMAGTRLLDAIFAEVEHTADSRTV